MGNELTIQINANTSALEKAKQELENFGDTVHKVGEYLNSWTKSAESFSIISVGIGKVFNSFKSTIGGLTTVYAEFAQVLNTTSAQLEVSVKDLSALKYAAEQNGTSFEAMTNAMKAFNQQLGAARLGDQGAINKLESVGIDYTDFNGLASDEAFKKLANHIATIDDKAKQTKTSIALFGDAGYQLIPMLSQGSKGINDLCNEAENLGYAMGDISEAMAMEKAIKSMTAASQKLGIQFMTLIAGPLTDFIEIITSIISKCGDFITSLGCFGQVAISIITGILAVGVAFGVMTAAISACTAAFGVLTAIMALNPIGMAAFAFIGAGIAIATFVNYLGHASEKENEFVLNTKGVEHAISDMNSTIEESDKKLEEMNAESRKLQETIDRLEELAEKENLSNSEMEEQSQIIDDLNAKFPELGAAIEENTGKVKDLNQAMVDTLKIQARQQAQTIRSEQSKIEDQIAKTKALKGNIEDKLAWFEAQKDGKNNAEIDKHIRTLHEKWDALDEEEKKAKEQLSTLDQDFEKIWDDLGKSIQKNMEAAVKRNLKQADAFDEKEAVAQMTPEQKAMYDIDQKYAKPRKNLQAALDALNQEKENRSWTGEWTTEKQKQMDTVQARLDALDARETAEKEALQAEWQREVEEWTDTLPEVGETYDPFEKKNSDIAAAEAAVQVARDKQATAILNNNGVHEADQELEEAKQTLAKTIAKVSGQARDQAKSELEETQKKYDEMRQIFTDKETLEPFAKAVMDAQAKYDKENESYFNAIGQIRKADESDLTDAVQTTLSGSGTFSAYGMDATASYGIQQKMLDTLLKILEKSDETVKELKDQGSYTK